MAFIQGSEGGFSQLCDELGVILGAYDYVSFYLCLIKKFRCTTRACVSPDCCFFLFGLSTVRCFWLVTPENESGINGDLANKKCDFCYCD